MFSSPICGLIWYLTLFLFTTLWGSIFSLSHLLAKLILSFVEPLPRKGCIVDLLYTYSEGDSSGCFFLLFCFLLWLLDLQRLVKSSRWSPIFLFLPFKLFLFYFSSLIFPPFTIPCTLLLPWFLLPLSSYIPLSCFGSYIMNVTTFFIASLAFWLEKYSPYDAFGCLMSSQSFFSVLHYCRKNYLSSPLENLFFGWKTANFYAVPQEDSSHQETKENLYLYTFCFFKSK